MRVYLVMILVVATGAAAAPQQLSLGRHVTGGIIGSTLGFGLGHKIQSRWWHGQGWGFTLSEMYALTVLPTDSEYDNPLALYTFIALKLAESISVWVPASPPKPRSITQTRYVAGGLVGMTLGFGSGHLIQGRWLRSGWPYTVSQALSAYVIDAPCKSCKETGAFSVAPLFGIMLLLASKILETVSIWATWPQEYRVTAAEMSAAPTVIFAPIVHGRGLGLLLAKAL